MALDTFQTHQEELDFLNKLGFTINPLNETADNLEEIWKMHDKMEIEKDKLNYPIDGLVVKLNDNNLLETLGIVGKTHRGWSAIKFPADEVTTSILGVTWQVGRTGKVTPVAELEPVELAGTTVKRATLHNFKEFVEKNLFEKDTLVVRKAGEIIPEVVEVMPNLRQTENKFIFPEVCPSCSVKLSRTSTEVDLICLNYNNCPAQISGRLSYFTQRNLGDIVGLSEKIIERLIKEFGVSDVFDLFNLPFDKIENLEGFGEKSVQNLQKSVERARNIKDYKFLAGLGIDGVGPEVAKLICEAASEKIEKTKQQHEGLFQ